ncbi:hypothetical protein McpSp1_04820 [Methanocorpusculaceae archaeon Sp1]|nr:hypothetical protein [Methanocorpusculaceae archaeon Sp1]
MKKYFSGVFALCVVAILISSPAYALEISEKPEIIYEFQDEYFYKNIATDGNYILISELKSNKDQQNDLTSEFRWIGNFYLYDISDKTLRAIAGDSPVPGLAKILDGVVYYKSASKQNPTYYRYKPETISPEKLNIPTDRGSENFITDGTYFIVATGTSWPDNVILTLYNLQTGDSQKIPTLVNPDPDRFYLSGTDIIYQQLRDAGNNLIYIYNITSGQTKTTGTQDNYQMLLGASENNILYLWNEEATPQDGKYQLNVQDIKTGKTTIICDEPMYLAAAPERKTMNYQMAQIWGSTILWPGTTYESDIRHSSTQLYGISLNENTEVQLLLKNFSGWEQIFSKDILTWIDTNDQTGTTTVYMTELIVSPTMEPLKPVSIAPSSTTAGSPIGMIIGTIAFVLACVLAILWRKK